MMGTPNCSKWIYPYLDLLTTGAICRVYCFLGIYHNLQLGPHPPLTVHSQIYNKLFTINRKSYPTVSLLTQNHFSDSSSVVEQPKKKNPKQGFTFPRNFGGPKMPVKQAEIMHYPMKAERI